MKMLRFRKKNGFTLVELVIASAFTTIIVALIFSMFLFGNRTFDNGSTQNNIQNDLRLASDIIRDEVRYASDLSVLVSFVETAIESDKNYIYLSDDKKSVMLYTSGGSSKDIISFSGTDIVLDTEFSKDILSGNAVSFSHSIAGSPLAEDVLQYTISGSSAKMDKTYEVKSDVIIMNMKSQISNLNYFDGPIAYPGEGTVPMNTQITLSSIYSANIYYTLNGSKPDITSGILYEGPITLTASTTIRAIAAVSADLASTVAVYEYTIIDTIPSASGVIITPQGTVDSGTTLTVTYTYTYNNVVGDVSQGLTKIEWFKLINGKGEPVLLQTSYYSPTGPNNFTYTVGTTNKGDTIYVIVTPKHISGLTGNAAQSNDIFVSKK